MSHLPVNAQHTHSHAHTRAKFLQAQTAQSTLSCTFAPLRRNWNILSIYTPFLFLTWSPVSLGVSIQGSLSPDRLLTAVGARLMTSSGFPYLLCYSELFRLRSYCSFPSPPLFSTPSSQPPLTRRGCHAQVSPLTHVEVSQSALVASGETG